MLIDASNLGEKVKEGKNQRTVLSKNDEVKIIDNFKDKEAVDNFSVVVTYEDIEAKDYSLSAGQYFEVKIGYMDITQEEFAEKMQVFSNNLDSLRDQSREIEAKIKKQMAELKYE